MGAYCQELGDGSMRCSNTPFEGATWLDEAAPAESGHEIRFAEPEAAQALSDADYASAREVMTASIMRGHNFAITNPEQGPTHNAPLVGSNMRGVIEGALPGESALDAVFRQARIGAAALTAPPAGYRTQRNRMFAESPYAEFNQPAHMQRFSTAPDTSHSHPFVDGNLIRLIGIRTSKSEPIDTATIARLIGMNISGQDIDSSDAAQLMGANASVVGEIMPDVLPVHPDPRTFPPEPPIPPDEQKRIDERIPAPSPEWDDVSRRWLSWLLFLLLRKNLKPTSKLSPNGIPVELPTISWGETLTLGTADDCETTFYGWLEANFTTSIVIPIWQSVTIRYRLPDPAKAEDLESRRANENAQKAEADVNNVCEQWKEYFNSFDMAGAESVVNQAAQDWGVDYDMFQRVVRSHLQNVNCRPGCHREIELLSWSCRYQNGVVTLACHWETEPAAPEPGERYTKTMRISLRWDVSVHAYLSVGIYCKE